MTQLGTIIFVPVVTLSLLGVHLGEKICEDRTVLGVANTSVWKPVIGPLNRSACPKGAETLFEPVLHRIYG
jgi:hypothetical protein